MREGMNHDDVLSGLAAVAAENLGWQGPLPPGLRLVEDMNLDSIRLLTLLVAVEDRFQICLEEGDETGIATVGDLAEAVRRKLAR